MELVRINATLDKKAVQWIDQYAEEMHEDRSTAIRQLLGQAILEKQKKNILQAFKARRITIRQAADALGVDYWTIQEFLAEANIPLTDMTDQEIQRHKHDIKKFLP